MPTTDDRELFTRSLPDLAQEFAEEVNRHVPQLADLARPHLFAELTEAISDARAAAAEVHELEAIPAGLTPDQELRDRGLRRAVATFRRVDLESALVDIPAGATVDEAIALTVEVICDCVLPLAARFAAWIADGDPAPARREDEEHGPHPVDQPGWDDEPDGERELREAASLVATARRCAAGNCSCHPDGASA